jgi:hypothetical protein
MEKPISSDTKGRIWVFSPAAISFSHRVQEISPHDHVRIRCPQWGQILTGISGDCIRFLANDLKNEIP